MTNPGWENDLAAHGLTNPYNIISGRPVHRIQASCQCGTTQARNYTMKPPIAQVVQQFQQQGWEMKGKHNRCPTCVQNERTQSRAEAQAKRDSKTTEKSMTINTDLKHQIAVGKKLDIAFDEKTGNYKEGWSDKRIAEELRVSDVFVAKTRESIYGPMRVPSELEKLVADQNAWVQMGEELRTRTAKLIAKFSGGSYHGKDQEKN